MRAFKVLTNASQFIYTIAIHLCNNGDINQKHDYCHGNP